MTCKPELYTAPAVADSDAARPLAEIFKALGDVTRLQLALFVHSSAPSPVCASYIPEAFGISQSTVSHHLAKLVDAGILGRERHGKWSYYSISPSFDTNLLDLAHTLVGHEHQESPMTDKPTTILFACRKNAGRSQIAAAIAQSLAPEHVTILSAGTEPASEAHPEAVAVLEEIGLKPTSTPSKLDPADVKASDWVITMGCGESCPIFPGTRYEDWPIDDPADQPIETVRRIRDDIRARVEDLLERALVTA
ncbi:ArsR family transcriptional regulator [Flaviflexus salsibiostraticola]|uniref:ArsR family transcriptional regulator n=1 Tax=Flaviflexus salsibiostraticola TaxID=1282737 RepID=A0A3Q8WTF5_9ACTO|nr:metalloregulator ArsR/SmtB family transcription factor [Flaviflexus salsibiostraticola]AZN29732.1 ArsR family transcriptional regulator [Flaviflexus salsibiostraticola]